MQQAKTFYFVSSRDVCFGEPFAEMSGNIIKIAYHSSRKAVSWQDPASIHR
ncbi:MAG: hypothetical protein IJS81_05735 [Selenomonadaceae bacterium]|nr:hypothetical protein [Selenomonadaceae bacterium]